jgi:hypothetical protein
MSTSSSNSGGVGFAGLLAIVFITLKLTGVISWSWVWVLSPIWITLAFGLLLLLVGAVLTAIVIARSNRRRKRAFQNQGLRR